MNSDVDAQYVGLVADISALASHFADKRDKVASVRLKNWIRKLNEVTTNERWKRNRNQYLRLLLSQLVSSSDGGRLILMSPFDASPPQGPLPTLSPHLLYRFSDQMGKTSLKLGEAAELVHPHLTIKPTTPALNLHQPSHLTEIPTKIDSRDIATELDGILGRGVVAKDPLLLPPSAAATKPAAKSKEEEHALLRLRLNRLSASAERLRLKREDRAQSALNKSLPAPAPAPALPPPPYALARLMIKRAAEDETKASALHPGPQRDTEAEAIQQIATTNSSSKLKSKVPILIRRLEAAPPPRSSSPPRMIRPFLEVPATATLSIDKRYSSPPLKTRPMGEDEANKEHEEKVEVILSSSASPPPPSSPTPPPQDPRMNIAPIPRPSPALESESPPSARSFSFTSHNKNNQANEKSKEVIPTSISFFNTDRFSSPPPKTRRPSPSLHYDHQVFNRASSYQTRPQDNTPGPLVNLEESLKLELLAIESRVDECKRRVHGIWKLPSMCGDAFLPLPDEGRQEAAERQRRSKGSVNQLGRAFLQLTSFIDSSRRSIFGSQHETQHKFNQAGRRHRDTSAPHSRAVNSSPHAAWRPGGRAPPSPHSPRFPHSESPLLDEPPYHRFISSGKGKVPPGLPCTSPPLSPVSNSKRREVSNDQGLSLTRACSVGRGGDGSRAKAVIRAIETLEGEICELSNALVRLSLSAPSPLQIGSNQAPRTLRPLFHEAAEAADRDHLINQRMVAEQEVKMEADEVKRSLVGSCQKMTRLVKKAAGIRVEEVHGGTTHGPPSTQLPPSFHPPSTHLPSSFRPPLIASSHASGRVIRDGGGVHHNTLMSTTAPGYAAVVRPLDLNQTLPSNHRPSSLISDRVTAGRHHHETPLHFDPVTFPSPPRMVSHYTKQVPSYDGLTDVTGKPVIHLLPPKLKERLLSEEAPLREKDLPLSSQQPPNPIPTPAPAPAPAQPEFKPFSTLLTPTEKDTPPAPAPAPASAPASSFVKSQVEAALDALGRTLASLAPLSLNKPTVYKLPPPPPPPINPSLGMDFVRKEIAKFRDDYASLKTLHDEPASRPSDAWSNSLEPAFLPTKDPVALKMFLRDSESFNQEMFERYRKLKNTLNISSEATLIQPAVPDLTLKPLVEESRAGEGQRLSGLQARLKVLHGLTADLQNKLK